MIMESVIRNGVETLTKLLENPQFCAEYPAETQMFKEMVTEFNKHLEHLSAVYHLRQVSFMMTGEEISSMSQFFGGLLYEGNGAAREFLAKDICWDRELRDKTLRKLGEAFSAGIF